MKLLFIIFIFIASVASALEFGEQVTFHEANGLETAPGDFTDFYSLTSGFYNTSQAYDYKVIEMENHTLTGYKCHAQDTKNYLQQSNPQLSYRVCQSLQADDSGTPSINESIVQVIYSYTHSTDCSEFGPFYNGSQSGTCVYIGEDEDPDPCELDPASCDTPNHKTCPDGSTVLVTDECADPITRPCNSYQTCYYYLLDVNRDTPDCQHAYIDFEYSSPSNYSMICHPYPTTENPDSLANGGNANGLADENEMNFYGNQAANNSQNQATGAVERSVIAGSGEIVDAIRSLESRVSSTQNLSNQLRKIDEEKQLSALHDILDSINTLSQLDGQSGEDIVNSINNTSNLLSDDLDEVEETLRAINSTNSEGNIRANSNADVANQKLSSIDKNLGDLLKEIERLTEQESTTTPSNLPSPSFTNTSFPIGFEQAANTWSSALQLSTPSCPVFQMDLPAPIDRSVATTIHCDLYSSISPILSNVMFFLWSFAGFRIVMEA